MTLLTCLPTSAQQFFNLTAQEVRIDSVLPVFNYTHQLGYDYGDYTYRVAIDYPEFIPMSDADVKKYEQLSGTPLSELPEITLSTSVNRKKGVLHVAFVPLVFRNGQYQKLVSFQLKVLPERKQPTATRRAATDRYAANSVLASGRWVKISVPSTGIYQLTDALLQQAGFSDQSKVKIYGYGGAMQPELLTADYVTSTDDLKELPTCWVNGKRLFYGVGPVSWTSNHQRIRNPYSTAGYYFLTESDATPQTLSWEAFLSTYYPLDDDYCTLYETEDYAWFQGGRNLYDSRVLTTGQGNAFTVPSTGTSSTGTLTVMVSSQSSQSGSVSVSINGTTVGNIPTSQVTTYDKMKTASQTFTVTNLKAENEVRLTPNANSGTVRLDYISIYANKPKTAPNGSQDFPAPSYVGAVGNQNRHADSAADMVIIIPTSQKLMGQAVRLKSLHEQVDGFRVNIVTANELYNEFSSGTPDANAYRRYLKMLYDRAATEADMPRYLLLLGDCAWDNRMLCPEWKSYSPDDFLLCYESENSFSQTKCYVSDDFFCLLDDNEGGNILKSDQTDAGVGRIPARTAEEAASYIDKVVNYTHNQEAASWQNLICFMGDDGNDNQHMEDADQVATMVETNYPDLVVKRIMWDAYNLSSSSTGNTYPDVARQVKQLMQQGALIMDYSGHGSPTSISHEVVLKLKDFQTQTSMRVPLWITASCDIMPFDGQEDNIGESAIFNKKGGAIAFYGTTRTVYQPENLRMNLSFTNHVLRTDESGKPYPIGEAVRLTKNELITTGVIVGYDKNGNPQRLTDKSENRMQYSLLGDPALRLAIPTEKIEIETINDTPLTEGTLLNIKAGSTAKVTGRILDKNGQTNTGFNGFVTGLVRDVQEKVTCRQNRTDPVDGSTTPFVYYDRPNTVFNGSNTVTNGEFTFTFAVPMDIKYADQDALINLYAVNNEKTLTAHGRCNSLALNGTSEHSSTEQGPDIYCYLNSESFTNGGDVNTTPYFVAELNDENGINASGNGIGHDLLLIIDGNVATTYTLNDYFNFDFGSYTKGKVGYSIPKLSYGQHKLQFRAWDVLNNSSLTELKFNVVKGLEPVFVDVECSPNPARTSTTFRIIHDRTGTEMDVKLDVFDTSGRHLWTYSENGVPTDNTYTVNWDLTVDGGHQLHTGLYLYRLSISSEGSTYATKAKKLIVITNQ